MSTPKPGRLILPIDDYNVEGHRFGKLVMGRYLPSMHLGEDVIAKPGSIVKYIGDGEAVWSEMRLGSHERRNWGGVVVVKHQLGRRPFYSVYGHLNNLKVKKGDRVFTGGEIGEVAPGNTPQNGWWKLPHLHFAIYTGPWRDKILPGYWRLWEKRTFPWHWRAPQSFIDKYNLVNLGENEDS